MLPLIGNNFELYFVLMRACMLSFIIIIIIIITFYEPLLAGLCLVYFYLIQLVLFSAGRPASLS